MAVKLRGSVSIALIAWTVLAICACSLGIQALASMSWRLAGGVNSGSQTQETYTTTLVPNEYSTNRGQTSTAGLDFRVEFNSDVIKNDGVVESGEIVMKARMNGEPDEKSATLKLDAKARSWKLIQSDKELASGATMDEAVVENWFRAAGIDVTHPNVKVSVSSATDFVQSSVNDPSSILFSSGGPRFEDPVGTLQPNGGSSSTSQTGGPMFQANSGQSVLLVGVAGSLAIWLLGCVGIIWRHRAISRPSPSHIVTTG